MQHEHPLSGQKVKRFEISHVSKREEVWQGKRMQMCRRQKATFVQVKRGDKLTDCLGGVPLSIKHDQHERKLESNDL